MSYPCGHLRGGECKGPQVGTSLICSRKSNGASEQLWLLQHKTRGAVLSERMELFYYTFEIPLESASSQR